MEIGSTVKTLVDKHTSEGGEKIFIPKGTEGLVCEVYETWAFVEIWGPMAPKGVCGVFDFDLSELEEVKS